MGSCACIDSSGGAHEFISENAEDEKECLVIQDVTPEVYTIAAVSHPISPKVVLSISSISSPVIPKNEYVSSVESPQVFQAASLQMSPKVEEISAVSQSTSPQVEKQADSEPMSPKVEKSPAESQLVSLRMQEIPGVLLYEIAKYAECESIPVMELFSKQIRNKLVGNLSAFQHLLNKENFTSDKKSFDESKEALRNGKSRLITLKQNTKEVIIYSIRTRTWQEVEIADLEVGFCRTSNWICMNSDQLLIGCGWLPDMSDLSRSEDDEGWEFHKIYSIISLKKASVVKTGQMNEPRSMYGLVKIQHMYYAILGFDRDEYQSESIDIYDHTSGQWELISDLEKALGGKNPGIICAIEFKNMIYFTGEVPVIFKFDPSSRQLSKVFQTTHKFAEFPIMVKNTNLIMRVELDNHKKRQNEYAQITFDGENWEQTNISDKIQGNWPKFIRKGDYVQEGDDIYFINVIYKVCRISLSSYEDELIDKVFELDQDEFLEEETF